MKDKIDYIKIQKDRMKKETKPKCIYCKDKICFSNKKLTVKEWNKCPWQRADWEVGTSIICWLLDIITLYVAGEIIRDFKIKKYSKINIKRNNQS